MRNKKRLKSDIWGNEAIRSSYFKEQCKQMKYKVTVLLFFVIKIIAAVALCFDSLFLFILKPLLSTRNGKIREQRRQLCLNLNVIGPELMEITNGADNSFSF